MAGPDHPLAGHTLTSDQIRRQSWNLGPSAVEADGVVPAMLRNLGVPEPQQRIFQSHAAALEEATRGNGVALAVGFSVSRRPVHGPAGPPRGPGSAGPGPVDGDRPRPRAPDARPPPSCCGSSPRPRATQAMVRGAGGAPRAGSSRPCTSPSGAEHGSSEPARGRSPSKTSGSARRCAPAGTRRRTAAPRPSRRPAVRSRSRPRAGSARPPGGPAGQPWPWPRASSSGGSLSQPSRRDHDDGAARRRRRGARRSSVGRFVAMRVPPKRSTTCALGQRRRPRSGERCASTGREPGQRGREREHLGVPASGANTRIRWRYAVGVGLHRLADVAQQHDPPRPA